MEIILNFAISADGKIGTHKGGASHFTSRKDLERLWEIRKSADAIMVGRGTLEADNMSLTIPEETHQTAQPLRFVISRNGHFNFAHPLFQKKGGDIHLCSTDHPIKNPPAGITTHHLSLQAFLDHAASTLKVNTLLCEGGGSLVRSLVDMDVVTKIHLTIGGHLVIGGLHAPSLLGPLGEHLEESLCWEIEHFEPLNSGECFLTYRKSGPSESD